MLNERATIGIVGTQLSSAKPVGKVSHVLLLNFVTEFPLARSSSSGFGSHTITSGPDGALWFTDSNLSKIGRITTGGSLTQFISSQADPPGHHNLPGRSLVVHGVLIPLGENWACDDKRFVHFFPVASSADGVSAGDTIDSGPDGKMWFTSSDLNTDNGSVGNITVS